MSAETPRQKAERRRRTYRVVAEERDLPVDHGAACSQCGEAWPELGYENEFRDLIAQMGVLLDELRRSSEWAMGNAQRFRHQVAHLGEANHELQRRHDHLARMLKKLTGVSAVEQVPTKAEAEGG